MLKPYYQDDLVTIYHGDNAEIVPQLEFGCIVTDPPYGINVDTDYTKRGGRNGAIRVRNNSFPRIHGDDRPFDPTWLLELDVPTIMFGANHYADRRPASTAWIVWDKLAGLTTDRRDVGFCDQADVELAWSNLKGPARIIPHRWMGIMKHGREAQHRRVHPTQKPVEMMAKVCGMMPEGLTILDPYMGSGSTLRAAKDLGRPSIGIEIEEQYCEAAAERCRQDVLFGEAV